MSVLTKIFVSVLVVLSLLLSAATITFVSAIGTYQTDAAAQISANQTLKAQLGEANTAAQAQAAAKDAQINSLNEENRALTAARTTAEQNLGSLGQQLASAKSELAIAQANLSKTTSAVNALQTSNTAYQQQIATYRDQNDKLQTQSGELNVVLTETTNKLDITEAQRRTTTEQLIELRAQLDKVSGALRDRGVDPTRVTSSGLAAGAPAINGIIRRTSSIGNIPHASISVGAEDAVKVGMEFNVVDRGSGKFLGKMTIIAVEPNEAVGRLTGPNVTAIAAGAEVRTQL